MNQNIPQLATVKINCNEVGTAVIYFPDPEVDYVYVLTAKHCLTGKQFKKDFANSNITLDHIFNEEDSKYYSYTLTDSDIVHISKQDDEDMALLILLKKNILPLTGKQFFCQVIDTDQSIQDYEARGFASFNDQEADRSFKLRFEEDQKDKRSDFLLRSEKSLDTFFQQALENVEGLSGSGAYSILHGKTYFTGIIHSYENNGIFVATKVLAYNKLIPPGFILLNHVKPEIDEQVLTSYKVIERNENEVNDRTREKIGNFNVPRDKTELLQAVKNSSVIAVHGNPGVGKSALTKSVVNDLKSSREYTILTFTAENLYCETLTEALEKAGCQVNIQQLMASPLSNKYFLIWIESFEKLVESNHSGAFNELLTLIKGNTKITIILTIRDYLLQKFKINFKFELPENTAFFQVNEFNDDEIQIIRTEFPDLNTLLDNRKIEHLLRTPYYLDRAVRIVPELLKEKQLDEVQFKRLMWDHIVEKNNLKRGTVFYDICLKRSREMSLFTFYNEDVELTADLVKDNILQSDNFADGNTFSPSHDILEDWALVRFIRKQKAEAKNAKDFMLSIENAPAMKRAFRLWLEEYYAQQPTDSVNFVHQLLNDDSIKQSWKDELLIVSLRSSHSMILLESLKDQFLLDSAKLLKKVIFLLQTGCKKLDPIKRDFNHLLPVGSGWDYVIDFIREHLLEINEIESFQVQYLNLIEAWSKQLPEFNQQSLPSAAKSAVYILENFIYQAQIKSSEKRLNHSDISFLNRYIIILFKLTKAEPEPIELIIDAIRNPQNGNARWMNLGILRAIRNSVVDGVNSDQICRFFPDTVFQMVQENWAKKEEKHRPGSLISMMEHHPDFKDFGLDKNINHHYRTPSGYQTFFYWMFLHHPERALDFVIPFLNKAFHKNQENLKSLKREILDIKIVFEDGTERQYYGNYEYWTMFRGITIYNDVVSSLLMGLEKSLLDLVDCNELTNLNHYLTRIISESNNVAMLGVVASVLQANPVLLDEFSVSLLGVPSFFKWDSTRYSIELLNKEVYNEDPFERSERINSVARNHRTRYSLGLVGFVIEHLFYERNLNGLIFKQIDKMWENVSDEDVLFKKKLFDMDVRKYEFKPIEQQGYENYVQLIPDYDDDIQQIMKDPEEHPKINLLWAKNAFDNKEMPNHNYETWKIGYDYIIKLNGRYNPMVSLGTMAALALRDFSDQLEPSELQWCHGVIINFAKRKLEEKDPYRIDFDFIDSKPLILGICYLFKKELDSTVDLEVKEIIFRLLLSKLDNEERYTLQGGMAQDLFFHQKQFVINCWYGLINFVKFQKEQNVEYARRKNLYNRGELRVEELQDFDMTWQEELIMSVVNGTIVIPEDISVSLDLHTQEILDDTLRIIPWKTDYSLHYQFIQNVLQMHLNFVDDRNIRDHTDYYESRRAFKFFYARFLLNQPPKTAEPLFKALIDLIIDFEEKNRTDRFLKYIYDLVEEFIRAVNYGAPVDNFWILWDCLRVWTVKNMRVFFMPLFLIDIEWSETAESWTVLEGRNLYYKTFINEWGDNMINSSIKFLNGIAYRNFMPDSISWITLLIYKKGGEVDTEILEKFIEKAFYDYGREIKQDQEILHCFLFILELLIVKQSPKAYMLKDELLQYKIKI